MYTYQSFFDGLIVAPEDDPYWFDDSMGYICMAKEHASDPAPSSSDKRGNKK